MKVLKFIEPYTKEGKTKFPERNKTGVYIIKENGKIVYVGYSENDLYKTLYRHFQTWNHTTQEVVTYQSYLSSQKYTVRVIYCTINKARSLEKSLIKKYEPRDNSYKYEDIELSAYDKNTYYDYQDEEIAPF